MLCRLGRSVDTCPNYGSTLPALQPRCMQSQASGTCGNISRTCFMTICLRAAHEHAACSRDVGNAAALDVDSILMEGAASKSYGLKRRTSGGLYTRTFADAEDARSYQYDMT